MPSIHRAACLLVLLACSGCGTNLNQIGASSSDYADYRAFRVAPALSGRLRAASVYLQGHSEGAFRGEVAGWFDKIEPLFFQALSDSAAGVQTYLDAPPGGPPAQSAVGRGAPFLAPAPA